MLESIRRALSGSLLLLVASVGAAETEYRVPANADVVRLLTATQPPGGIFNAQSGRVVFIYR